VVFTAPYERAEYHPAEITPHGPEGHPSESHGLYDFYDDLPPWQNVTGKDTTVILAQNTEITSLLQRHNRETTYTIAFEHPMQWDGEEHVKDDQFLPLMEAAPDQIVAFSAW